MSSVNVTLIQVLNNPAHFTEPFQFEITFECIEELSDDLEWRIIYVGSSESQQYDQLLDEVLVGPVPIGTNKFVFQADAPDPNRIPVEDLLGVTVVLLTCSYRKREFIRVGYYVNNEYEDQELRENPPAKPVIEKIVRNILAEKPRVTTFSIPWGNTTENEADIYVATMQQQQQQYTYQAQQHPAGSSNVSDGMMEEEDLDANAEEDEQELDEEDEEDEEEDASMEDESMEEDDGEGESTADEATPAATTTSAAAAATTTTASTGTDNMEA